MPTGESYHYLQTMGEGVMYILLFYMCMPETLFPDMDCMNRSCPIVAKARVASPEECFEVGKAWLALDPDVRSYKCRIDGEYISRKVTSVEECQP